MQQAKERKRTIKIQTNRQKRFSSACLFVSGKKEELDCNIKTEIIVGSILQTDVFSFV